jgi:hypothetical protein
MEISAWLTDRLTRAYVLVVHFSTVSRSEVYRTNGEEHKVFWLNTDNWDAAGECTAFNTILLNERRLGDAPKEAVDYVFLHEIGHTKPSNLLILGSYVIQIILKLFAIVGIPALFIQWAFLISSGPSVSLFLTYSAAYLILVLLIVMPVVAISWLNESYAELFAVSKLGTTTYLRCYSKMDRHSNRGLIGRIRRRLFYPSPSNVVRIANWLDGRTLCRGKELNFD